MTRPVKGKADLGEASITLRVYVRNCVKQAPVNGFSGGCATTTRWSERISSPVFAIGALQSGEHVGRSLRPEDVIDPAVEDRDVRACVDTRALVRG